MSLELVGNMEIEIVNQRYNPLLEREEVEFIVKHPNEGIPSREVVKAKVSAMLNKDQNVVVLQYIKGSFGKHESEGRVHIYASPEEALKNEPKHILKRQGMLQEEEKE